MAKKGIRYGPQHRIIGATTGKTGRLSLSRAARHDRDLDRLRIRPGVKEAMDREFERAKRRVAKGVDFRETYLGMLRSQDPRLTP